MELARLNNILAIHTPQGRILGFHTDNLEVAELSTEAWLALKSNNHDGEAFQALKNWSAETSPTVKSGKLNFGVRSLTINVTQVCNLHCTYCAAGGDGTFGDPVKKISIEKTLPQLKFLLSKLAANSNFSLTFLGGEPLLYPQAIEMIADYVKQETLDRNISTRFNIVTNGTLLNDKTIPILVKMKSDVTISIDGPPEINDRVRPNKGGNGSTAQVIEGLLQLTRVKDQLGEIMLSGVFGSQNLELEKAYDFYKSFNVDYMDFTFDHVDTTENATQEFVDKLKQVAAKAYREGGEKNLRKIKTFDYYFERLDSQQRTENYCGAGKSYFVIDARNNLYTCPWVVGDSKEVVGHSTALWNEKLTQYQDPLIEKNSCHNCWAKYLCGGGCMFIHKNKTGDKHQVDTNFCIRTRSLITESILYYDKSRSGNSNTEGTANESTNQKRSESCGN